MADWWEGGSRIRREMYNTFMVPVFGDPGNPTWSAEFLGGLDGAAALASLVDVMRVLGSASPSDVEEIVSSIPAQDRLAILHGVCEQMGRIADERRLDDCQLAIRGPCIVALSAMGVENTRRFRQVGRGYIAYDLVYHWLAGGRGMSA